MRVFLDANVLFSAADPASATRALLEAVFAHAVAVTNRHAWEEAQRNLDRKRAHLVPELAKIEPRLELTARFVSVPGLPLPDKDLPVIGGAVAARCTHLWTSDRQHFGGLYGMEVGGTKIVSSVMLADELVAQGWL
jgi:hypothetical protein